jgi:capsular polysaccharide biosynthesis protein
MIKNYLSVVRRRWFVIPAVLLVAASVLVLAITRQVTVTSRVVVPFPGDQNDQNFQGVAQSYAVAKMVIHDVNLRGETPYQVLQQVSVAQEYGTNIYDVTVKDSNKARATRICNTWVNDTIALYTKLNTAPASLAFTDAQQQLASAHQKISDLQQKITQFEYAHPELVNVQTTTSQSGSQRTTTNSSSSIQIKNNSSTSNAGSVNSSTTPATAGSAGSTSGNTGSQASTSGTTSGSNTTANSGTTSTNVTATQATNNTPGSVNDAQTLADLKQQLQDAQVIYDQLASVLSTTQLANLQTTQRAFAQVLDTATPPPVNVPLLLLFTLLLGVLLGLALIFGWEYFDRTMHSASAFENAFGVATVVEVARRPSRRELRHVAPGSWALPAPTQARARPGHWPTVTVASMAALADAAMTMRATDNSSSDRASSQLNVARPFTSNGHTGDEAAHETNGDSSN